MKLSTLIAGAVLALGLAGGTVALADTTHPATKASVAGELTQLRQSTAKYRSIAVAELHKYGMLTDAKGIACIAMPSMPGMPGGGMGVHWVKSSLVGDPAIDFRHPEALVYAPQADHSLRLAAVEYIVLKKAWLANHQHRPHLFGHVFNLTTSPNRFGLPPFYSLHVWVWQHNPAGMFKMWNPDVSCAGRNAY